MCIQFKKTTWLSSELRRKTLFNINDYKAIMAAEAEQTGEMRFDIDKIIVAIVIAVLLMFVGKIVG